MAIISLDDARNELLDEVRAKTDSPVLYDLGCGIVPFDEFKGLDAFAEHERVDKVDLYATPWKIADESVDYYRSSHFLEHVPDWDAHFAEVYRTLKPGGYYEVIGPFYRSDRWFGDPDHKQPLLYRRFVYLNHDWRKRNNISHYGATVNFSIHNDYYFELLHPDYLGGGYSDDAIAFAKEHFWNVIDDIAIILRKEPMEAA